MVGVSEAGRTALLRSGSGSLFRASGGRQGDPMVALTYEWTNAAVMTFWKKATRPPLCLRSDYKAWVYMQARPGRESCCANPPALNADTPPRCQSGWPKTAARRKL